MCSTQHSNTNCIAGWRLPYGTALTDICRLARAAHCALMHSGARAPDSFVPKSRWSQGQDGRDSVRPRCHILCTTRKPKPSPAPRGSPLGPNQWFCGAPVVRARMPTYVVPFTVWASTCERAPQTLCVLSLILAACRQMEPRWTRSQSLRGSGVLS